MSALTVDIWSHHYTHPHGILLLPLDTFTMHNKIYSRFIEPMCVYVCVRVCVCVCVRACVRALCV